MRVAGLDLSLAATGVADGSGTLTLRPKVTGPARLAKLRDEVLYLCQAAQVVAIEGYAFGRPNQATAIGELGGVVKTALYEAGIPYVLIPPGTLKKFATGRGNATKPDMRMALYKRAGLDVADDNQVDAWWLRAAALDYYGEPLMAMPALNRSALASVTWPVLTPPGPSAVS